MSDTDDALEQLVNEAEFAVRVKQIMRETIERFTQYLLDHGVEVDPMISILIAGLAMCHGMGKEAGMSTRKQVECHLWDIGLLESPFTDLVAAEFEGEGLTDAELDQHIAGLPDRFVTWQDTHETLDVTVAEYKKFLLDHGHVPNDLDEGIMYLCAQTKLLEPKMKEIGSKIDPHESMQVIVINKGRTSEAWSLLLDREFLGWFD